MPATATTAAVMTATLTIGTIIDDISSNTTSKISPKLDSSSQNTHSDEEFDDSQCLFCDRSNADLNRNLEHMSKAHGLHIDLTDLLVDVESLLRFIHLLIFECHECIYCGTKRSTRQAVQQHMTAKGHCKYDVADENSELYDFFGQSPYTIDEKRQRLLTNRFPNDAHVPSKSKLRKSRSSKSSDNSAAIERPANASPQDSETDTSSDSDISTRGPSLALSTRILKQEHTLQGQLSRLRAADRQSLAHLPSSQQRAILATRHKQMEQARRIEQTYRSHLEGSGNHFGRLDRIRLTRMPPHTGNVHSLNR